MTEDILVSHNNRLSFEALERTNIHGAEYWSARDLQPLLGYSQWRRFEDAIKRAMTSCEQSGNPISNHFAGAGKMVKVDKGGIPKLQNSHVRLHFLSHLKTEML
jgi:DNA-damage-inducible protein D